MEKKILVVTEESEELVMTHEELKDCMNNLPDGVMLNISPEEEEEDGWEK